MRHNRQNILLESVLRAAMHTGKLPRADYDRACRLITAGENAEQIVAPPNDCNPSFDAEHADDVAVDEFAAAMKAKLAEARAKGRGGWETCDPATLSLMLREHVEKGDPRDVANFCMMLHHHSARTNAYGASADAKQWWITEGHRGVFPHGDRLGWEGAAKYGFDAGRRAAAQQTTVGYCREGENHCVCGGDLPRVREGCGNWVKGT